MENLEQTLVILKPDAIKDPLATVGVLGMLEQTGLTPVKTIYQTASEEQIKAHYAKDDDWCLCKGQKIIDLRSALNKPIEMDAMGYGRKIVNDLVAYIRETKIVAKVYEGVNAVQIIRDLVGDTEPISAKEGTIRRTFSSDSYALANAEDRALRNIIHCSDSPAEAEREIKIWFGQI